jgi:hypothetical protein
VRSQNGPINPLIRGETSFAGLCDAGMSMRGIMAVQSSLPALSATMQTTTQAMQKKHG